MLYLSQRWVWLQLAIARSQERDVITPTYRGYILSVISSFGEKILLLEVIPKQLPDGFLTILFYKTKFSRCSNLR